MEPQFKIRQQQEEWQQGIADLKEWERSQKAKDSKATRGTSESQPTRQLAPIRYADQQQAHILCVIQSRAHVCGVYDRGLSCDNGATVIEEIAPEPVAKPQRLDNGKENHAAMHTHDHSKAKWDNFTPEEEAACLLCVSHRRQTTLQKATRTGAMSYSERLSTTRPWMPIPSTGTLIALCSRGNVQELH